MTRKVFSLLNYVGHKSKILDQIMVHFPKTLNGTFWDVDDFSLIPEGSGSGSWDNTLPISDNKDLTPIRCTITPVYPTVASQPNIKAGNAWVGPDYSSDPVNNWGNSNIARDICYP